MPRRAAAKMMLLTHPGHWRHYLGGSQCALV